MSGVHGSARALEARSVALVRCARGLLQQLSCAARACLVLGAVTVLAGCGQKGPLVLPDRDAAGTAAPPAASPSSDDDDEEAATDSASATGRRNGTGNGTDGF